MKCQSLTLQIPVACNLKAKRPASAGRLKFCWIALVRTTLASLIAGDHTVASVNHAVGCR